MWEQDTQNYIRYKSARYHEYMSLQQYVAKYLYIIMFMFYLDTWLWSCYQEIHFMQHLHNYLGN